MSIFVNELFHVPFKRDAHVPKGAPEDFYPNGSYQHLSFSDGDMDAFVKARPDSWPRDLSLMEKTIRRPDRCAEEFPKNVLDEFCWARRVKLEREFEIDGKRYVCICRLFNVDGRFSVPLIGCHAPLIKEIT